MTVFLMSGVWHGFYPFYYVMFFMIALLSEINKDIYKSQILFKAIPNWLQFTIAYIMSCGGIHYLGIAFTQLSFENGNNFFKATYYFVIILIFLLLFLSRSLNMVGMAKKMEKKIADAKVKKES